MYCRARQVIYSDFMSPAGRSSWFQKISHFLEGVLKGPEVLFRNGQMLLAGRVTDLFRLYGLAWANPSPQKMISHIEFSSAQEDGMNPVLLAISVGSKPLK